MTEADPVSRLVVVGASAGGVEALSQLVATLPASFPAPIILAQHLDPSHLSHLREILGRAGTLTVRTIEGSEQLENGIIYVIPPNRDVEVTDHEVRVVEEGDGRPKPSIDRLFSSAAAAFGEELIAVILTGSGSDGADGARMVKEYGGTVIIQNPQTASYPSMPLSLPPTLVDIVADLPAVGSLLSEILSGAYMPPAPEEDRQMRSLLDQLRQQSGIDFSQYRQSTIQRRLLRRMADTGASDINAYLRYLQRHPEEYQRLVATFLIKVADFFRDADLFDYLRETLLPRLIEEARQRGSELRLWSAGCATGEEPYSLAILVAELLGDELEQFRVRIFATDVDPDAIDFARRGIYPVSSLRSLADEHIRRYFSEVDGAFEVRKQIRAMVLFGHHDLGQRAPFPHTDLVLCRNVLIYFTPELRRRALQIFAFSLRPEGRLILGKSESTTPLAEYFTLEESRLRVYRRQGDRVRVPPPATAPVSAGVAAAARVRQTPLLQERELARAYRSAREARPLNERPDLTLLNLPFGVIVVDEHYDIVSLNLVARRLLGIHGTAVGEDFIHLSHLLPSNRLRALIDGGLRRETPSEVFHVRSPSAALEQERVLQIRCYRQEAGEDGATDERSPAAVVTVLDITDIVGGQDQLRAESENQQAEVQRVVSQLGESQQTVSQLLQANEQLSRSNAILRSQNEDLLLGSEEAQAAAEEIETLSEEQQAANEELETLNEELQSTIEELNTTNEDLHARSAELQDLAAARESERQRISAILASMADAAFAVNRQGEVVFANPTLERWFGANGALLIPEDEEGRPLPPEASPQQRAARGDEFTMHFTITAADGRHRWYEATGQPVAGSTSEAGVVTVRDITDRTLRRLQEEFTAVAAHELRTPVTVIEGSLQMIDRQLEQMPAERLREYLALSLREAHRLRALTEELLDAERLETGRLRLALAPVDVVPIAIQAVAAVRALSERQEISFTPPEGQLIVNGDPMRLEQVMLNLLNNAVVHAPRAQRIDVRLQRKGEQAKFEVQDYGPGIPAAELQQVFNRFYQATGPRDAAARGLGLGLYISHEIVQAHGGTIEAQSEEGRGSIFTVFLPLASEGNEPPRKS